MDVSLINITHIKARFKVNKSKLFSSNHFCFCNKIRRKAHKNICVLDCKKLCEARPYTFIIFYSGDVNIVGLRKKEEIALAVSFFCSYASLLPEDVIKESTIDNITATGKLQHGLNLTHFFHFCKRQKNSSFPIVAFNPSIISVLYLTFHRGGRLIFGKTGKFSIVGVKKIQHLKCIRREMIAFMRTYAKTEPTLSVNNVD